MKIKADGTISCGGLFRPHPSVEELRDRARREDIHVWPANGPRFPGDTAPFRYRRGGIEVGSLTSATEEVALRYLLGMPQRP